MKTEQRLEISRWKCSGPFVSLAGIQLEVLLVYPRPAPRYLGAVREVVWLIRVGTSGTAVVYAGVLSVWTFVPNVWYYSHAVNRDKVTLKHRALSNPQILGTTHKTTPRERNGGVTGKSENK